MWHKPRRPQWQRRSLAGNRSGSGVLAGANKEGAVSLWGDAEITHPDIVAAFTKEIPFIKPITVTGKGATSRCVCYRRGERGNIWPMFTAGR